MFHNDEILLPGDRAPWGSDAFSGDAKDSTFTHNGVLRSSQTMLSVNGKFAVATRPRFFPCVGDLVYGVVPLCLFGFHSHTNHIRTDVKLERAIVRIMGFHHNQYPTHPRALTHPIHGVIQQRDASPNRIMVDYLFRINDIVRGSVKEIRSGECILQTIHDNEGVWSAECAKCESPLAVVSEWCLGCLSCATVEFRKISAIYLRDC